MSSTSKSKVTKVIDKALRTYADPVSVAHREIRRTLLLAQTSTRSLSQAFAKRSATRIAADKSQEERSLAEAMSNLGNQRLVYDQSKSTGSPELICMTEAFLKAAELRVNSVKMESAWRASVTAGANSIDEQFEAWLNKLMALSVEALSDSAALEKALALASAATILGGLDGGALAILSTLASAALLAREVMENATEKGRTSKRDQEIAREEAALILIQATLRVATDWESILVKQP